MDNPLEMIIWDVQHGNAMYLKTPNGTKVLFDIGTDKYGGKESFSPIKYLKDKYSVKAIDYLVISHPHTDHISDINNVVGVGLKPRVLTRPKHLSEEFIKSSNEGGEEIIEEYLRWDKEYTKPVPEEENPAKPANNGGVTITTFRQKSEGEKNINNHSAVSVIEYAGEKIILPGDIETVGWKALLDGKDVDGKNFKKALKEVTILMASHHGRESGFCEDIFEYFSGLPDITIVSDGKYTETDVTGKYRSRTKGTKVKNRNTEEEKTRKVLTTRSDGVIYIAIGSDGSRIITIG